MACPNNCNWDWCDMDCDKLRIGRIKACSICVKDLFVDGTFSAKMIKVPDLCAGSIIANKLDLNNACVGNLGVASSCIQNLNANNAKIVNLEVNDLCIAGRVKYNNPLICDKFGATAVTSSNALYNLGDLLNFDAILSNPSGAMSVSPSTYTAPVSGNYILMLQIDQNNLIPNPGFGPILGTPFANPQILVNGIVHREIFSSYMPFFNEQKTILTVLLTLAKNDKVQFKFNVLAISESSGLVAVPGTISILGDGTADDKAIVRIQLSSVICPPDEPPCDPVVPCDPCQPQQCDPSSPGPCGPCMFE